eukprot:TRINITY_DN2025_c4_g1_i1.p1 TRINITY_DN2025_c4_g1~~TRINITY_DN2025_c4_g1_i1.p1  ORF type:complete len:870 (+),score=277.21 TRINITY_DN2025_c4_g1_i1:87-2612(+)
MAGRGAGRGRGAPVPVQRTAGRGNVGRGRGGTRGLPDSPRLAVVPVASEEGPSEADLLFSLPSELPKKKKKKPKPAPLPPVETPTEVPPWAKPPTPKKEPEKTDEEKEGVPAIPDGEAGDENAWANAAADFQANADGQEDEAAAHPAALFSKYQKDDAEVTGPPAVIDESKPGDATGHAAPDEDEGDSDSDDDEMEDQDATMAGAPDLGDGGVEAAVVKKEGDLEFGFSIDDNLIMTKVKEGTPAETAGLAYLTGMKVGYINGRKIEKKSDISTADMSSQAVLLGLMKVQEPQGQLVLHGAALAEKRNRPPIVPVVRRKEEHKPPPVFRPPTLKPLPTFVQMFLPVYKAACAARANVLVADKSKAQGREVDKEKAAEAKAKAAMRDPNAEAAGQKKGGGALQDLIEDNPDKAGAQGAPRVMGRGGGGGGGHAPSVNPHGKGPGWTPQPPPSVHPDRGLGFDPDRERGTAPGGSTSLSAGRRFRHVPMDNDSDSDDGPGGEGVVVVNATEAGGPPLIQPMGLMGAGIRRPPPGEGGPGGPGGIDSDEEDDRRREADMAKNRRAGSQDSVSSSSSSSSSSSIQPTEQQRKEATGPGIYRGARERGAPTFGRIPGEGPGAMGGQDIRPGQTAPGQGFVRRELPQLTEPEIQSMLTKFKSQYPVPDAFNLEGQLKQLDSEGIRSVLRPLLNTGRNPTTVLTTRINLEKRRCRQDQLDRVQGGTVRDAGTGYNEPATEEAPDPYTFRYAPKRQATMAASVVAGVIFAARALEALAEAYTGAALAEEAAGGGDVDMDSDSSSSDSEARPPPPVGKRRRREPQPGAPEGMPGSASNPFSVEPDAKRRR